jgi:hypothetical protein
MVNVWAFDALCPGLTTVTEAVPSSARSVAGTEAVSCVELTNVVVRAVPFQSTVEPLTKLAPLTVSVKPGPPSVAEAGLILVVVGLPTYVNPLDKVPTVVEFVVSFTTTLTEPAACAGVVAVK